LEQLREREAGWLTFLGGGDNKIDERFLGSDDLRLIESPITTAEAYLVDRVGCERRLAWLADNLIDRQADHLLNLVDQTVGNVQYRVSIPMATQGSITGLFETHLDSSRAKHGPLYLLLRYHYNRWRRQTFPRLYKKLLAICRLNSKGYS